MNTWGPFTNFTAFPLPLTAYFHKRLSGPALAQNQDGISTGARVGLCSAHRARGSSPARTARPAAQARGLRDSCCLSCPRPPPPRARSGTSTSLLHSYCPLATSRRPLVQPRFRQRPRAAWSACGATRQEETGPKTGRCAPRQRGECGSRPGPELWLKCSRKRQLPCESLAICGKIPILQS